MPERRASESREDQSKSQSAVMDLPMRETESPEHISRMLHGVCEVMGQVVRKPTQLPIDYQAVLATIGQAVDVDRAYIFQFHRDPSDGRRLVSQRSEWVRENVSPQIDNPEFQNAPVSQLPRDNLDTLDKGECLTVRLDETSGWMREQMIEQDIQSLIFAPIPGLGDEPWGFVGFDDCREARTWTQAEIDALTVVANALGLVAIREQS